MKINQKILAGILSILAVATLIGCTSKSSENDANSLDSREIKISVAAGFYPITYADDDGNACGYDVDVMKAVDEMLDNYSFTYEITDKETMNVGVQTATYQMGINSLFKTDERCEIYIMPDNNMGNSPIGFVQREDDNINSFSDAYNMNKKIYPVQATSGIRLIVDKWNEEHSDMKIEYPLRSESNYAELFDSIKTGAYDYAVELIPVYNLQPEEAVGGLKVSDAVAVIPTYPIINMDEKELADSVNESLKELKENGTLSELAKKHFGYDIFELE